MKQLGADFIVNKNEDVKKLVTDVTGGVGVDVVLEMTGSQEAIDMGLSVVRKGGRFTAFGLPSGAVKMSLAEGVIFKGATIVGINGRLMYKTWYAMQGLLRSGRLNPKPVITHTYPMEKIDEAMQKMKSPDRSVGKIVLLPFGS